MAIAAAEPHCQGDAPSADWAMVMALALWNSQDYERGLAVLQRVDASTVRSADFYGLCGMLCRKLPGQESRAEEAYKRSLALDPRRADMHYNLGNLLRKREPQRAIDHYRASLLLDPQGSNVWHNYGATLNEHGEPESSLQALHLSLLLDPHDADTWCNLGLTFFQLERFEASKACFVHSIGLDQGHATSHVNYGQVLIETLQPEEALQVLRRGVELDSSSANALWNLSLALLLLGQYRDGWRYYEARFHTPDYSKISPPTPVPLPRDLEALPGEDGPELIVWSEQGIGDGLQFCRYLSLLKARGVPFHFLAHKPLVRLYRHWLGLGDHVSVRLENVDPHDEQRPNIPLLSLPHLFGTELHSVPSAIPYLKPPSAPPEHLKLRQPPGGLAIGVVWATNPANKAMYRNKSMPAVQLLPPLVDAVHLDLIELHSLQVGGDAEQLAPWRHLERVTDWSGTLTDFADTAHLIQQLDLVISVDTAVAHLAGALGKPTWLLLAHNADFRWMHQRSDTPWYPGMRLFRQPKRGDWPGLMAEVQEALNQLFLLNLPPLAEAMLRR